MEMIAHQTEGEHSYPREFSHPPQILSQTLMANLVEQVCTGHAAADTS